MQIQSTLSFKDLESKLDRFWKVSGQKLALIHHHYDYSQGSPVFTVRGEYTTRGWTEWTEGFLYGSAILQYDMTNDDFFLQMGRNATLDRMAAHVSHIGVHDHGFNNVSTYGNLLRLGKEGKLDSGDWENHFYSLALKLSGAIQASRWSEAGACGGYIYSFNGPHSLFVDTIRSCRALVVSHLLGHQLMGENDQQINLLHRAMIHSLSTAKYSVYYGEGRDTYDLWGRTAHESVFNQNDGNYRCPNTQQGFSGFTTWTRGLAWAMTGFAELLEAIEPLDEREFAGIDGGKESLMRIFQRAAEATCDFYILNSAKNGIPYWDTGAPDLHKLGTDYLAHDADPFNDFEPVDSSAAAIGAQGLLRLGRYLGYDTEQGNKYWQAGLTVLDSLLDDPYLSLKESHQGLLLHSVYHHPNGWDHIPEGYKVPLGESSMWGDYHMRELALYVQKMINNEPYYTFWNCTQ